MTRTYRHTSSLHDSFLQHVVRTLQAFIMIFLYRIGWVSDVNVIQIPPLPPYAEAHAITSQPVHSCCNNEDLSKNAKLHDIWLMSVAVLETHSYRGNGGNDTDWLSKLDLRVHILSLINSILSRYKAYRSSNLSAQTACISINQFFNQFQAVRRKIAV